MKSKKMFVLFIIIILLVISAYRYWEKPIDKSYDCIYVNDEETKNVTVRISGTIYSSLIQDNRMRYRLWVDDYELPLLEHAGKVLDYEHYKTYISDEEIRCNLQPMINQEIKKEVHNNVEFSYCVIGYRYLSDNDIMPESIDFGELFFENKHLDHIAISLKGEEALPEGYIISAVDVESAKEMLVNLFGFKWKL